MLSTFMEGVELAKALQKEDEIIENLEKLLQMEEEE